MVKVNEAARFTLEVGAEEQIPAGRACRLIERDGAAIVYVRPGHAAPGLRTTMNAFLRVILEVDGRWAQIWDCDAHRIDEAPKGLGLAEVEWQLTPGDLLPRGVPCVPLEEEGRFVWAIRGGLASQQLCREMNIYFKRLAGDGLWVQRWPDTDATHN